MNEDVVIVSAVRTPFGKFCGTLRETPTYELGAFVMEKALEKAGIPKDQVAVPFTRRTRILSLPVWQDSHY